MTIIPTGYGCILSALTEDNREIHIVPLLLGRARIGIGPVGEQSFDDIW